MVLGDDHTSHYVPGDAEEEKDRVDDGDGDDHVAGELLWAEILGEKGGEVERHVQRRVIRRRCAAGVVQPINVIHGTRLVGKKSPRKSRRETSGIYLYIFMSLYMRTRNGKMCQSEKGRWNKEKDVWGSLSARGWTLKRGMMMTLTIIRGSGEHSIPPPPTTFANVTGMGTLKYRAGSTLEQRKIGTFILLVHCTRSRT